MTYYVAVIEGDAEGGYCVFFPDIPGCTSAGATVQKAAENAVEALELFAEHSYDPLPDPTDPDKIVVDDDVPEVARIMVPIPAFDGPTHRYNVTLPKGLVDRIDSRVGPGRRSQFLAEAARKALRAAS